MSINAVSTQLWPEKAKGIMKDKHINIEDLQARYKKIFFPWSTNYETERLYFSLRIQQRPLIIVKAVSTDELESILDYVYKKNLTIRVCGGRHSTQLLSPEVLVDISYFNEISYEHKTLIVGAGATQGQANEFLFTHKNLNYYSHFGHYSYGRTSSFPGGSAQSVGVGGISTVGGIGVLRRTFGLTIDSIISFIITLPPTKEQGSRTIEVKKTLNPDLFWALCGGGANNFGIISKITYELFEVNDIVEYEVTWDFDLAKEVIDLWCNTAINRPKEFTEELDIYYKNGVFGISLSGFYVVPKNESDAKEKVTEMLQYLGGTLTIEPTTKYSEMYKTMVKNRVYHNFSILQGVFTNNIDSDFIINSIKSSSLLKGDTVIEIELLGGKIKESDVGSFGYRKSNFFANINCAWENLEDTQASENWLNSFTKDFIVGNGVYLGFPITFTDIEFSNRIYYGESYEKLQKIKKQYDPENVLTYSGTL